MGLDEDLKEAELMQKEAGNLLDIALNNEKRAEADLKIAEDELKKATDTLKIAKDTESIAKKDLENTMAKTSESTQREYGQDDAAAESSINDATLLLAKAKEAAAVAVKAKEDAAKAEIDNKANAEALAIKEVEVTDAFNKATLAVTRAEKAEKMAKEVVIEAEEVKKVAEQDAATAAAAAAAAKAADAAAADAAALCPAPSAASPLGARNRGAL